MNELYERLLLGNDANDKQKLHADVDSISSFDTIRNVLRKSAVKWVFGLFASYTLVVVLSTFCNPWRRRNHDISLFEESDLMSPFTARNQKAMNLLQAEDAICHNMGDRVYSSDQCLGPPYLLVTFHGGELGDKDPFSGNVHNVCKFSRDGCSMGVVLMQADNYNNQSLRGLHIEQSTGRLLVVEMDRHLSTIRYYSDCNPAMSNRREPMEFLFSPNSNPGIIHPYHVVKGLDEDQSTYYISVQDTYSIMKYTIGEQQRFSGQPLSGLSLKRAELLNNPEYQFIHPYDKRTIHYIADGKNYLYIRPEIAKMLFPNQFAYIEAGNVRGVATDRNGLVYVAVSKKGRGVYIYSKEGELIYRVDFQNVNPVSLLYDQATHKLIYACVEKNRIYELDCDSFAARELADLRNHTKHITGLSLHGRDLYFVSWPSEICSINLDEGAKSFKVAVSGLGDEGEDIALSNC